MSSEDYLEVVKVTGVSEHSSIPTDVVQRGSSSAAPLLRLVVSESGQNRADARTQ